MDTEKSLLSASTIERVRQENSFDSIRYFFALSLIVVHFCTVTDTPQFWFVSGGTRVKAFFIITGFLVVYSYLRRGSQRIYFRKRANRILPAYVAVVLLCWGLGVLLSDLPAPAYFTSPQGWKYLLANLSFQNYIEPCLPGLFADNPMPFVNGSLWSMKVEVLFYLCVPFFVWLLRRYPKAVVIAAVFLLSIAYNEVFAYLYATTGRRLYYLLQHQVGGQMIYFFGGTTLLLYFDTFCRNIRWLFPTGLMLYIASSHLGVHWLHYVEPISFAMVIIGVAYFCKPLNFLQRYDNISYGLYLWHFPVIQVLVHFRLHDYSLLLTFVLTLLLTTLLATLSWYGLEKRFVRRTS